jgi:hypothetical protein
MVVVEFMPAHLQAAHVASGHVGIWPYNGAVRIAVEKSCAERMQELSPEWVSVVHATAAKYANQLV